MKETVVFPIQSLINWIAQTIIGNRLKKKKEEKLGLILPAQLASGIVCEYKIIIELMMEIERQKRLKKYEKAIKHENVLQSK